MEETALQEALGVAFRYLSPRPRSIWEMRRRLSRQGLEPQDVEQVLARLQERGFLDDAAFVRFWVEGRESFRPRGRRMLEQELRIRGVSSQDIAAGLEAVDEEGSAWRAAQKKAQSLRGSDYVSFASRLGGFLRRRGFSYEVVAAVTRRLWLETGGGGSMEADVSQVAEGEEDQDY